MTDTIWSSHYGKTITIGKEFAQGGQGPIFETDDPNLLIKQCEPAFITDDPKRQEIIRHKAELAYQAFCVVNKATHAELKSLPREYVCLQGKPGYLMEKAEGALLQTILRGTDTPQEERLALGCALARALSLLHAGQMIHTDVHPENYIVRHTPGGFSVSVIDIDGGGLLGPPGPIYPMSQPQRLYKAPELFTTKWRELHERGLLFAPDNWALAVLLYQLLVDYQGPFCSAAIHPDPAITNYQPHPPFAYREPEAVWPLPWQEALLKRASLPDRVVSSFYATFQYRFVRTEQQKRPRPTASEWERALQNAITPPPPVPVSTVRVPPPPPVRAIAPPGIRHGWTAKARRMFLTIGARLTTALGAALLPRHGALRWRPAVAGTVTALRLSAVAPLPDAVPGVVGLGQPSPAAHSAAGVLALPPGLTAGADLATLSNSRGLRMSYPPHHTLPVSLAPQPAAKASVPPVVISEREEQIIHACLRYQFLTVVDFCFLLGLPASRSYVRKVLARLAGGKDHTPGQYLYRFPLPQRAGGNPLRVFVPGTASREFLWQLGAEEDYPWTPPATMQNYSYSYVSHNLAAARLAVCAALFARERTDYYLAETRLASDLVRDPPRLSPEIAGQETAGAVIPDVWVLLKQTADDRGSALWFEVDNNGTEAKTAFQRRLRARLKMIESEAYASYFGTPAVVICYAVLGKSPALREARLRTLRTWTTDLLAAEDRAYFASKFRFTVIEYETLYEHPDSLFLDPIWQLPDEPNPVALLAPPETQEIPHDPKMPDQTPARAS